MHKMTTNPPQFNQLSSLNPDKDSKKKVTMRPGVYADMLKSSPEQLLSQRWRNLNNY